MKKIIFGTTLMLSSVFDAAADWMMFRGPTTNGIADTEVPVRWSREENLRWATEIPGFGSSSPVISGEAVFVTSYTLENDKVIRHLSRLDFDSGEILWTKSVPPAAREDSLDGYITEHGYASNTPVTDGETVFTFLGRAGVFAYDFEGDLKWQVETGTMPSPKKWGSGSSPVLYANNQ